MGKKLLTQSYSLIREALTDPKIRNDLAGLDASLPVKTYAAIAVMLIHRHEFLDEENRVIGNLGQILERITGGTKYISTNSLTDYSKIAGLHRGQRSAAGQGDSTGWEVFLTPPNELMEIVASIAPWRPPVLTVEPGEPSAPVPARRQRVQRLTEEDMDVLADVYRRLRTIFEP